MSRTGATDPSLSLGATDPTLSRRSFLVLAGLVGGATLAGCNREAYSNPTTPNAEDGGLVDELNEGLADAPQSYEGDDPNGHAERFNEVMGDLDAHPELSNAIRDALNTDDPDIKPSVAMPFAASYSFFGSRALLLSVVPTPSEVDGTERTLVTGGARPSRDPRLGGAKYYYTGEESQNLNPGFLLAAYPEYEIHVELVAASSPDEFARRQSPGVEGGLVLAIKTAAAINNAIKR